jgi:hypothetical protein
VKRRASTTLEGSPPSGSLGRRGIPTSKLDCAMVREGVLKRLLRTKRILNESMALKPSHHGIGRGTEALAAALLFR